MKAQLSTAFKFIENAECIPLMGCDVEKALITLSFDRKIQNAISLKLKS